MPTYFRGVARLTLVPSFSVPDYVLSVRYSDLGKPLGFSIYLCSHKTQPSTYGRMSTKSQRLYHPALKSLHIFEQEVQAKSRKPERRIYSTHMARQITSLIAAADLRLYLAYISLANSPVIDLLLMVNHFDQQKRAACGQRCVGLS